MDETTTAALLVLILLTVLAASGGVIVEEIDPCAGGVCIVPIPIDHVEPFAPVTGYKVPGATTVDIYDR